MWEGIATWIQPDIPSFPELPQLPAGLHIIITTTPSTLPGQVKGHFLIQSKVNKAMCKDYPEKFYLNIVINIANMRMHGYFFYIRYISNIFSWFPGPGSHSVPTDRPWPFPHPWDQGSVVTNRPGITAETVKPTPTASKPTEKPTFTFPNLHLSHHNQQNHHMGGRTQTRDQLFLSRLRNRYRQVWWLFK